MPSVGFDYYHALAPVHACMQQAIRAGVKCIEHGRLADEATAKTRDWICFDRNHLTMFLTV